jgi:hypothetical protein
MVNSPRLVTKSDVVSLSTRLNKADFIASIVPGQTREESVFNVTVAVLKEFSNLF